MPPSNLAALLRAGASSHPEKIAFTEGGLDVPYGKFAQDIAVLAGQLVAHGIGAGDLVGVHIPRQAAHCALILALMRLGAVSVSLTSRHRDEIETLPSLSALLCVPGKAPAYPRSLRLIEVDSDWLSPVRQSAGLPEERTAASSIGRICFTSGSSGAPKAILLDAETLTHRLGGTAARSCIGAHTVLWCGLGIDTAYGFTATLATWMAGGNVLFATKREDILNGGVNLVIASPAALQALLRPSGGAETSVVAGGRIDGTVIVAGGRLSITLRDAVLRDLCSDVRVAYGSSEAGGVTLGDARDLDLHPGIVGQVFPDLEVEIVDATGTRVPADAPGRLRIKTRNAATAYLRDPVATAEHFKDGWFYPGDVAMLRSDGLLAVLGTPSQVVNVGGIKLSPEEIETAVRRQPGITDACTVLLPRTDGSIRLAIAVAAARTAFPDLPPAIRKALPDLPPFSVVAVSAIPRNSMGKVNREEFSRLLAQHLRDPASAQESDGFVLLKEA
jgi:acyl-coenzyme A synthetase/AMP-(fatty) acid ligase